MCKPENEGIRYSARLQRQKRSNSARLPQFSKLATSKTKQFCETSFNNEQFNAEVTALRQCILRFFQSMSLKYCACHNVIQSAGVLRILTWKCAARHNGVHFFDIATSKSGPNLLSFAHFDLKMCFAPQRRAVFHLRSGDMALRPPL